MKDKKDLNEFNTPETEVESNGSGMGAASMNVAPRKTLNKRKKDMIFVACLVTLPLIHYLIFYIYVNINSIVLAFQSYDNGVFVWNDFANFERFFKEFIREELMLICLKNSFTYYIIHTLVSTTACLFFSFYIFKKRFASKLFKVVLFLPSIISSIALTLIFKYFTNFAIPEVLEQMFGVKITGLTSSAATRFPTIVFYGIWVGFGSGLLMYSGSMSNISDSVMEAAQIDGAGELKQFYKIAVPLIYPTLTTFLISGMAGLFTSDMHLYAFYGGGAERDVYTLGYWLVRQIKNAGGVLSEYPYPATIGLILTFVSVPLTFAFRWALNKFGPKTV